MVAVSIFRDAKIAINDTYRAGGSIYHDDRTKLIGQFFEEISIRAGKCLQGVP